MTWLRNKTKSSMFVRWVQTESACLLSKKDYFSEMGLFSVTLCCPIFSLLFTGICLAVFLLCNRKIGVVSSG